MHWWTFGNSVWKIFYYAFDLQYLFVWDHLGFHIYYSHGVFAKPHHVSSVCFAFASALYLLLSLLLYFLFQYHLKCAKLFTALEILILTFQRSVVTSQIVILVLGTLWRLFIYFLSLPFSLRILVTTAFIVVDTSPLFKCFFSFLCFSIFFFVVIFFFFPFLI